MEIPKSYILNLQKQDSNNNTIDPQQFFENITYENLYRDLLSQKKTKKQFIEENYYPPENDTTLQTSTPTLTPKTLLFQGSFSQESDNNNNDTNNVLKQIDINQLPQISHSNSEAMTRSSTPCCSFLEEINPNKKMVDFQSYYNNNSQSSFQIDDVDSDKENQIIQGNLILNKGQQSQKNGKISLDMEKKNKKSLKLSSCLDRFYQQPLNEGFFNSLEQSLVQAH